VLLALLGITMALSILGAGALRAAQKIAVGAVAAIVIGAVLISSEPLFATVYGQMNAQADWGKPGTALQDVVETRSGVVTVDVDNAIFGGGVFDGWVLTDPHLTDTVIQPLSLAFFHPDPKDVLEIGMSGGAWSEIISNHPAVQHQTIVEINPGYVEVVRRHPQVSGFLSNPKVELVIDDGRRWMLAHRDRKFDLIVMDTIYHWRAHATNLLSVEMLNLARSLLKPGGVIYYNTTFSDVAEHTGAMLFPYAYRHALFMAVSDSPIQVDRARWRRVLENYSLEGKRMFDLTDAEDRTLMDGILALADTLPGNTYVTRGMETRENILRRTRGMPMITDDNMVTEWRDYRWR
jgi:spermidine synthase